VKIVDVAGLAKYCDFDVAVAWTGDCFEVRVLGSPAGETSAIRTSGIGSALWPGADGGSAPGFGRDVGPLWRPLVDRPEVGTALFNAVFHREVLVRFRESRRRAAERGEGLRIVLRSGPGVDTLPWELLYDAESRRFLALDPATPVVRCVEMPVRDAVPALRGPLRMVVAVATPAGLPEIDARRELRELWMALGPIAATGVLELVPVLDASLDSIRRVLADGDVHILHYIGHGSRLADGRGALELTAVDGSSSARTGDELGAILAAVSALRLVVLNSCHGAATVDDDPFAGPAAALVRAGVPAVLAMRHVVSDRAAIELSRAFYAELVAGARVERALTTARATLFARDDTLAADWPTAALYLGSSLDAGLTASPLPRLDEDVQFTVSRPAQLRVARWESMLVFAHRSGPYEGAGGQTVDPHRHIEQRVAGFFGADLTTVATSTEDARAGVPRGAGVLVVPDLPDVECEPAQAVLTWAGEVEEVRFLLRVGAHREGTTVDGWVRVFCGPLVIAETEIRFSVVGDVPVAPPELTPQPINSYRHIFACFSPRDAQLVASVAAVAEALGDRYTADVIERRTDGAPEDWMLPLIEEADVFQLFWSSNSMRSPTCRRQWEAALATQRSGFIHPLYWEHPFPRAPDLPPPALEGLRFVRLPTSAAAAGTTTHQLWDGTPTAPVRVGLGVLTGNRPGNRPVEAVAPDAAASSPRHGVEAVPGPASEPTSLPTSATGAGPDRPVDREPPRPSGAPGPTDGRRSSRRVRQWAGASGLAMIIGLVTAGVAAVVVDTSTTTGPPDVRPDPSEGTSALIIVAVGVGAFLLALVVLLGLRRRR
jgi:CHAT domain/TIR domain